MSEWLRPVFSRARTPVQGSPATFERQPSASLDELPEVDEVPTPKLRSSSRVSSYIGFPIRPSTPPSRPDPFQNALDPEFVYHRPSGDQMAETLKVLMMTRYILDPLPVEYNVSILHVLEAYQDLRGRVDAKQAVIEETKRGHARDIKAFEELTTQWGFKVGAVDNFFFYID
jgi:hypothetical protein